MGLGARGAEHVVKNLKQLTTLDICISCRHSGKNNIGNKGTLAIVDNLKQLVDLKICTAAQPLSK